MNLQKRSRQLLTLGAAVAALAVFGPRFAHAEDLYWDANGDDAGVGGSGVWDTAASSWRAGSTEGDPQAWGNSGEDIAHFGGTAGTVTLNPDSTDINVGGMNFTTNNYIIAGPENGTATLNLAGATPTITTGNNVKATISATIANGSLIKEGAGTLALTGANSYSGDTILNAGMLAIGNAEALGSGTLIINGGTISDNGESVTLAANNAMVWNGDFMARATFIKSLNMGTGNITLAKDVTITTGNGTWGSTVTFGGVISDGDESYSVRIVAGGANPGAVCFDGENDYDGGTILQSGTLRIGNGKALGTGPITFAGGTLATSSWEVPVTIANNNAIIVEGPINIAGGTGAIDLGNGDVSLKQSSTVNLSNGSLTIGGNISNVGSTGYGLVYVSGQYSSTLTLRGANTFDGGVTVTTTSNSRGATLIIANLGVDETASAIGTGTLTIGPVLSGTLRIDNRSGAAGTLATNNAQQWNGDFTFMGQHSLNMGTGSVTLGGDRIVTVSANTFTIGGAIGDGGNGYSLTKAGAGTMVLAGNNTYSGNTIVSAGTLTLADSGSILLDINDGSNSAILGTGTINLNGILVLDVADATVGEWTIVDPALNVVYGDGFGLMFAGTGTSFAASDDLFTASYGGRDWTFDRTSGVLIAVPEPGAVFGILGVAGLALARRRRSR